ncbi:MAG TPA: M23 family metallopeptidase [Actinomycetes bacterium]|nr:M23 family metallopeptidase [Actinomycetes bacterium]
MGAVGAVGAIGLLVLAPAAARAAGPIAVWTWPLAPPPSVVAPFQAPAGPYAPGHRGVDLAGTPGARVLAAGDGVVAFAGRVAGVGVVSVDHPGGLRTTYQPVTPAVLRGEQVTGGQVLGLLAGSAGHCPPAACLHWGLRRGTTYLDPLALLGPVATRVRLLPVWSAGPATVRKPASRSMARPAPPNASAAVSTARTPTAAPGRRERVVAGTTAVAALGAALMLARPARAGGGRLGARRVRLPP